MLIVLCLRVGSVNVVSIVSGGSSSMYMWFDCWFCRIMSVMSGMVIDSGIVMCV